ncbi:MAG: hypothetical protein IJ092_01385 [Atopobiaceae bacterium]|nr:hypothetical protein [Atopobiaceae bacterium]
MDTHGGGRINKAERGGTGLTIVCSILGALAIINGIIFAIMAISFLMDGEEWGLILFVLAIAVVCIATGALLIILGMRQGRDSLKATVGTAGASVPHATAQPTATPVPNDNPEVVSREVIAGAPQSQAPSGAPAAQAPTPVPTPTSAPAASPAPRDGSTTEEIANLVTRSENLFASLKDLVRNERSHEATSRHHLASMLEATGLMAWDDAPVCEAGRLTRNHHFWIRQNVDELSDEAYDRIVSIEAALSVNQDLGGLASTSTVDGSAPEVARHILGAMTNQTIERYPLDASLDAAYPGVDRSEIPGEWAVRASVASVAECAVTPFRVVYDERSNVAEGSLALSLEIPRPGCMAIFTSDSQAQVALARSYALRLATVLARHAIAHSALVDEPLIRTVYVNCHEQASSKTLLSLRLDDNVIARLTALFQNPAALEGNAFPANEAIRAQFGSNGWFEEVEPFVTLEDELVSPSWRFTYPELVDRPTSEGLRSITGARNVSELGINENAGRLAAWDELSAQGWDTTEDIVSKLKEMMLQAQDITVTEACNRTIEALVAGSVDISDKEEISRIFIKGTSLDQAVQASDAALDESNGPSDPEKAVSVLTEALSPIESLGAYLDDSDTVYRYFGSIAERIRFNLVIDDHRRAVKLVPDAYYSALCNLSVAYDELGETDKAMQYAEEMIRIAPVTIHATMRKVRVLEHQARIFEAADLIKDILRQASTPRDAAICHYRLAYMEWKLGREDLGVACYQRSLAWDTEMSQQAREELDDLLSSNEKLKRLTDDEVASVLAREGIPLGCDESDKRRMLASAARCVDEGVFWAARPLVGALFNLNGDDVMMGVYRSLTPKD